MVARARTVMVSVWVPAFPPIEATMGMSTARATICSMVASNILITSEAKAAVTRLTSNQAKRFAEDWSTPSPIVSSPTPPRSKISSSNSSRATSITSSTVIIPSNFPEASITPAVVRSYFSKRRATSSCRVTAGTST